MKSRSKKGIRMFSLLPNCSSFNIRFAHITPSFMKKIVTELNWGYRIKNPPKDIFSIMLNLKCKAINIQLKKDYRLSSFLTDGVCACLLFEKEKTCSKFRTDEEKAAFIKAQLLKK